MPLNPNELQSPNVDTKPTIQVTEEMAVRFSELAKALSQARPQAYIEANIASQLLDVAKLILTAVL